MEKDAIKNWSRQYDANYNRDLQNIEENLNKELARQEYITQEQLEKIIQWKLNGQPGRRDLNIKRMNSVSDEFIQRVSEAALVLDNPKIQLKTLTSIPGVGNATATVILAFYDPTNYAVGDRYIVHALLGKDQDMGLTDYPRILEELHKQNPGGFELRTIEKAYYQKYRDDHGIGRW
jgi:endonuclease III-like uncharacterized protein